MANKPNKTTSGVSFDEGTVEAVWRKGKPDGSLTYFRKDMCGASMQRDKYGDASSKWGWEIDHIKPAAKGGGDDIGNLQPLQWENNRHKSDNWPDWECKIQS